MPAGIDQKELNECLDSIHKESCGNPLETISRLAAKVGQMASYVDGIVPEDKRDAFEASLKVLREMMPDGILSSGAWKDAWAEDLCVYRRGELVFGTVTHEEHKPIPLPAHMSMAGKTETMEGLDSGRGT